MSGKGVLAGGPSEGTGAPGAGGFAPTALSFCFIFPMVTSSSHVHPSGGIAAVTNFRRSQNFLPESRRKRNPSKKKKNSIILFTGGSLKRKRGWYIFTSPPGYEAASKMRVTDPWPVQGASRSASPLPAPSSLALCSRATRSIAKLKDSILQVAKQNPIKRLG